jgi:hypothetical protein
VQADPDAPHQPEEKSKPAGKTPDSKSTDTPAGAEPKPPTEPEKKIETPPEKPKKDANGNVPSAFSKNAQRLEKNWKAVQERTTQLDASEAQLKQREQTIAQREQKAQLADARAKSKFTPEQYEQAASGKLKSAETLTLQADGLDRRAEQLEADGKYGEAELAKKQAQDLREQAAGVKYTARQMKEMAENLRKNPDPTIEQHKAAMEGQKKYYLVEAAKQWPDLAKDGSEFQKQMAGHLKAAADLGIDPNEFPSIFYHAARLTAAETAAARVPAMDKELGELRAKVKELELLTTPGGGQGSAQRQPEAGAKTDEQEEAELRHEANQRS